MKNPEHEIRNTERSTLGMRLIIRKTLSERGTQNTEPGTQNVERGTLQTLLPEINPALFNHFFIHMRICNRITDLGIAQVKIGDGCIEIRWFIIESYVQLIG